MIKKIIKDTKGVTLTALIISISVIMLLSGVMLHNVSGNLKMKKLEKLQSDIQNLREKISSYYMEYGSIPAKGIYTNTGHIDSISNAVDTGDFLVIDLSAIDNLTLNYGRDYENITENDDFKSSNSQSNEEISNPEQYTDLYIINSDSHNIFYVKGVEINGQMYYTDYGVLDRDTVPIKIKTAIDPTYKISESAEDTEKTNKYGSLVGNYKVEYTTAKGEKSHDWRLFYQDSKYTYLITDGLVGNYKLSDEYGKFPEKYTDGSSVSITGQRLNSKLLDSNTFTKDNKRKNVLAVAWLTDTEQWKKYKNGDALFAIGSPTADLIEASYNSNINATHSTSKKITLDAKDTGYDVHEGTKPCDGYFTINDSNGIYNKDGQSDWWIASPSNGFENYVVAIWTNVNGFGYNECNNDNYKYSVRPIVCITTKVFNDKYASSLQK